jgi:DNA-3-methyladenine glycosylase I
MSHYIQQDAEGRRRCGWCGSDVLYQAYHDQEWGRPTGNDLRLFEKLCLEGFQSGLSWITILRKRDQFRQAFAGFEMQRVARFNQRQVGSLLQNEGIIRHRGKIEATINNAARALEMQDQFGSLAAFLWQFEPSRPAKFDAQRSVSEESNAMSRRLKKLGWKFVGPTTCYSFMQAMGMVNDHHPDCSCCAVVQQARADFQRPSL